MLYGGCFTRIKHDERERMTMLSSFVSLSKRKKKREEKKPYTNIKLNKKMKRKKIKPRRKGRDLFFFSFFRHEKVNLGRDNRMGKISCCVRFVRVHVCLARREGYLRDRKKDFRTIFFACIFHLFSFFPFRSIAAYSKIIHILRGV